MISCDYYIKGRNESGDISKLLQGWIFWGCRGGSTPLKFSSTPQKKFKNVVRTVRYYQLDCMKISIKRPSIIL